MDEQNFKIRIIDFYKDVDKPILTNLFNDNEGKNILEQSTINDLQILKKEKNKWQIKDKRKLLKEIDIIKKRKVKEITSNFNSIGKTNQSISVLKDTNNKLISEIESIDTFKNTMDNDDLYKKLKNLALNSYPKTKNTIKNPIFNTTINEKINFKGGSNNIKIKIVDIKNETELKSISETDSDYIEIFSNSF